MAPLETLLVFTHPECPHSRALVEDLRRRSVRFVQIDLARNPAGLHRLREFCWEERLPVVLDHERISIGYLGNSTSFEQLGL